MIGRQLDRHLAGPPSTVLDVGAGQGTQSLRLARAGYDVTAVEPDAAMRLAFTAELGDEPADVQARVTLRAGSIDDLDAVPGTFDAVLLLGVLMYVPDPFATVAALASRVAPGGRLALAVRTTTSALWRPAARQDWFAARAAITEHDRARTEARDMDYVNEIGTPAHAQDFEALVAVGARHGLELEQWYGIRIAVDTEELDPPPPSDPDELAALLEVEDYLASTDPFRQLGQLAHLILRRPGNPATD
ncbi:MAG: methyltransferase domain-containing protein [Actinomycetota bacterium]|nr:methyltransferase domain-containing protein [Actinomycetota bacterium]